MKKSVIIFDALTLLCLVPCALVSMFVVIELFTDFTSQTNITLVFGSLIVLTAVNFLIGKGIRKGLKSSYFVGVIELIIWGGYVITQQQFDGVSSPILLLAIGFAIYTVVTEYVYRFVKK